MNLNNIDSKLREIQGLKEYFILERPKITTLIENPESFFIVSYSGSANMPRVSYVPNENMAYKFMLIKGNTYGFPVIAYRYDSYKSLDNNISPDLVFIPKLLRNKNQ